MTKEYAAESIGVHPRTLQRWWEEDRYGPERHRVGPSGRLVRYLKAEVDAWSDEAKGAA
ncbi:helix-turn-helix transcriptional regulator [Nocardiopsis nanhaiensis]